MQIVNLCRHAVEACFGNLLIDCLTLNRSWQQGHWFKLYKLQNDMLILFKIKQTHFCESATYMS